MVAQALLFLKATEYIRGNRNNTLMYQIYNEPQTLLGGSSAIEDTRTQRNTSTRVQKLPQMNSGQDLLEDLIPIHETLATGLVRAEKEGGKALNFLSFHSLRTMNLIVPNSYAATLATPILSSMFLTPEAMGSSVRTTALFKGGMLLSNE
ncbi:hypothetical protein BDZ45DRAFT_692754 [Acephala macrosclerotiorum]|nr:hypothetical protein BDZ45DRAFT_692754 [Acephala macrosclerotiorum]